MDIQKIRKEYEDRGIDESKFSSDPLTQFKLWYDEANQYLPGPWFEVNAMSLATSDPNGRVTVRVVLLKGVTEDGIQFFTNYDSAKGKQLAVNPQAAVAFHWPYLGRQVRIEGTTEKTSREISDEYFHSRPRGAQLSAHVSRQSAILESFEELDLAREQLQESLAGAPVPLPDNWGGYLLKPSQIEFWQGRLDRLHNRIVYAKTESGWRRFRIAP